MSLFGKKNKKPSVEAKNSEQTLQDIQKDFNIVLYKLGSCTYRKAILTKEIGDLNNEIVALNKEADAMGVKTQEVRMRIQQDMQAKVEEARKQKESDAKPETNAETA